LWPGGSKLELLNSADSAGDPVKGFGKKGAVELPKDFSAWEIVPAPKGGVAVVGEGSGDTMAVYRLGRSGRPLAGFGHRGLATVSFGKAGATAVTGLVEPDGDVVLTGSADGGVATVRLLPNGRPDPSFGNGGRVVVTDVPRRRDYGSEVASWDGGVVIAVTSGWAPYTAPGLIRLDRHGHQVHDFGRKGLLRLGLKKFVLSLLTGGGRIVAMTEADGKYRGGVELHAYNANGTIDRQFGDDGVALAGTHQKLPFQPVAAVQQPSGKITVAGTAWHGEGGLPELLRFR
jgi:hypothetical protein